MSALPPDVDRETREFALEVMATATDQARVQLARQAYAFATEEGIDGLGIRCSAIRLSGACDPRYWAEALSFLRGQDA